MDRSLMDVVDQLRLYGVEVVWVTRLRVGGLWSRLDRLLVLCATQDCEDALDLCEQALAEVRQPQTA